MKVSKEWFIRFEPNFDDTYQTIFYNKLSGELYELSGIYFDFIECIKRNKNFCSIIEDKYNIDKEQVEEIQSKIEDNLFALGVLKNE